MYKTFRTVCIFCLKLIFLKTPLIYFLKRRFIFHRNIKSKNYFLSILDNLFERQYLCKHENQNYIRNLISLTTSFGEGEKWSKHYFNNPAKSLEHLKSYKVGTISDWENRPIFQEIVDHIKDNKLEKNKNTILIQIGSSSGKDLEFFYNYFPEINYISTDINDEILNFQKKQFDYNNLKYYKCFAEDIVNCINFFSIKDKNILLFSIASLQYVLPNYLKNFFSSIKDIKNLNLFICEPVKLSFIDKDKDFSEYRGKASFTHLYDKYASGFKIIKKKIIRPYLNLKSLKKDIGTYYLHIKNY